MHRSRSLVGITLFRFSEIHLTRRAKHLHNAIIAGRAWSEHKLLRLAYAYEQASNMRGPSPGLA